MRFHALLKVGWCRGGDGSQHHHTERGCVESIKRDAFCEAEHPIGKLGRVAESYTGGGSRVNGRVDEPVIMQWRGGMRSCHRDLCFRCTPVDLPCTESVWSRRWTAP